MSDDVTSVVAQKSELADRKVNDLNDLLEDKITYLEKALILETRPEEQFRLRNEIERLKQSRVIPLLSPPNLTPNLPKSDATQTSLFTKAKEISETLSADVAFVVAKKTELAEYKYKENIDFYGIDYTEWKPFGKHICMTTQEILLKKDCYKESTLEINNYFISKIKESENKNRLSIIIIDACTLQLDSYTQWIPEYDNFETLYSAVLICFSPSDNELKEKVGKINELIENKFKKKSIKYKDKYFFYPIDSEDIYKKSLQRVIYTLNVLRMKLCKKYKIAEASTQISQPILSPNIR